MLRVGVPGLKNHSRHATAVVVTQPCHTAVPYAACPARDDMDLGTIQKN